MRPGTMIRVVAIAVFPVLSIVFVVLYLVDRAAYMESLREDGVVENLTVVCLVLAAAVALSVARAVRRRPGASGGFYVVFAVICLLGALEEISWGQRLLGVEPPAFFKKHSRQRETNAHNVFETLTTLKVKDLAPVAFIAYGIVLPFVARRRPGLRRLLERYHIVLPPPFLALGFALGCLAMLDRPTRREEEIGEFFLSLCLLLFMLAERQAPRDRARARTDEEASLRDARRSCPPARRLP